MEHSELKNRWNGLLETYTKDPGFIEQTWKELVDHYQARGRYYHNFKHLKDLFDQYENMKSKLHDPDVACLAIWYHDIIYKVAASNNEKQSAQFMVNRMQQTQLPSEWIKDCQLIIEATKTHRYTGDAPQDIGYVLDFDLAILGREWTDYQAYTQAIRKEYGIYPAFIYKPGRKKVLLEFLKRPRIYHTDYYFEQYENRARQNIEQEISTL